MAGKRISVESASTMAWFRRRSPRSATIGCFTIHGISTARVIWGRSQLSQCFIAKL